MQFIILSFFLFLSSVAHAAQVTDIRIGNHPDKTRLVIEVTGETDFHATLLNHPQRLSIRLPAKTWNIGAKTQIISPFSSVKHTQSATDLSRIDFTLSKPVIIQNAYMLQSNHDNENHRLVIDLSETSYLNFEKYIGRDYGSLILPPPDTSSLDGLVAQLTQNTTPPKPIDKPTKEIKRKPIIVIDAGHGGKDPGAISPSGILEKNITLPMAKTLAQTLNMTGRYDARLTRNNDTYIKLHNRVKIAQKANADMFISIHADSVRNRKTRGASIYTLSDKASDEQTEKLAARENRADLIGGIDLGIEDEDVSTILLDLSMRDTMNQSKNLANNVVKTFNITGIPTLQGPHRYAGFAVLKAPDIPSILIETGFVSNETEAKKLKTPAFQKRVSNAILKSIDHYFQNIN